MPQVERYDKYTLRMEDLGQTEPVTDREFFSKRMDYLYKVLVTFGIRHGDLTRYAIIVKDNHPYLIDFAESRDQGDEGGAVRRAGGQSPL